MELGKDRVGDPVLSICKESVKNSHTLKLWGGRAMLWTGGQ